MVNNSLLGRLPGTGYRGNDTIFLDKTMAHLFGDLSRSGSVRLDESNVSEKKFDFKKKTRGEGEDRLEAIDEGKEINGEQAKVEDEVDRIIQEDLGGLRRAHRDKYSESFAGGGRRKERERQNLSALNMRSFMLEKEDMEKRNYMSRLVEMREENERLKQENERMKEERQREKERQERERERDERERDERERNDRQRDERQSREKEQRERELQRDLDNQLREIEDQRNVEEKKSAEKKVHEEGRIQEKKPEAKIYSQKRKHKRALLEQINMSLMDIKKDLDESNMEISFLETQNEADHEQRKKRAEERRKRVKKRVQKPSLLNSFVRGNPTPFDINQYRSQFQKKTSAEETFTEARADTSTLSNRSRFDELRERRRRQLEQQENSSSARVLPEPAEHNLSEASRGLDREAAREALEAKSRVEAAEKEKESLQRELDEVLGENDALRDQVTELMAEVKRLRSERVEKGEKSFNEGKSNEISCTKDTIWF